MKTQTGKAYLVGAGPGDPDLLTLKGLKCIQSADVIIYDFLASPRLLRHARPDAQIIYVGKKGGDHTLAQDKINALIVEKTRQGKTVTRLKGGDPFIFGRGGEEAEELACAGLKFEIVPGVTSAIAAPAYAGIPLTHRRFNSTLAFVTGHEDPSKETSDIDWPSLAKGIGTLVFFMGARNLPKITQKLLEHGKPADTPVALVRWGTTPEQTTLIGTLSDIAKIAAQANLKPPVIIVVGGVVKLREQLAWFESRPLLGRRIVVTRARAQASDLVHRLADLGADVIECPTIKVTPPADWAPLDTAIENLDQYDWLVFTSVNGVLYFFKRLFAAGKDVRALGHLRTAVIGPVTAERLLDYGIKTDILPESFRAESILTAFESHDMTQSRVLLPRAEEARAILPEELGRMGATVDEVTAYRTEPEACDAKDLKERLQNGDIDMVTFTSSSTVRNFKALLGLDTTQALHGKVAVACIGPITADTARELGFNVHLVAEAYTIEGLCQAIVDWKFADPTER